MNQAAAAGTNSRASRCARSAGPLVTTACLLALGIAFAPAGCSAGARGKSAREARVAAMRSGGIVADHRAVTEFDQIPSEYVERAKQSFAILYGRTSHGSQIEIGMHMLIAQIGGVYRFPHGFMKTRNGDLGSRGNLAWRDATERALSGVGSGYNLVMWSWCGGVSSNDAAGIAAYLRAMEELEREHPEVVFVYMTGHANRWQARETRANNQLIRDYCRKNGKVLFDFEDIESWDLSGTFHEDAGDDCAWCQDWCTAHRCPPCTGCPHSHCLNCYNKAKAFWWMMARLAGWQGDSAQGGPSGGS